MKDFAVNDRVRTVGHWEWPDGITGRIAEPDPVLLGLAEPGEWQGHRRRVRGRKGLVVFYYVLFDLASDDGSGDGPYRGGEIEADCLEAIDAQSDPISN